MVGEFCVYFGKLLALCGNQYTFGTQVFVFAGLVK
jgi:hypothetical protein